MTPTASLTLGAHSLAETDAIGHRLGAAMFPGAVVALAGALGAGKTHLCRAIAEGLGIENAAVVNSPTFVLIQEYEARLPIYHFDAYRLQQESEFADLGVHEYFEGAGVCLVEWADKVPACLPAERLEIRISILGESSRRFEFTALGGRNVELLNQLEKSIAILFSIARST